MTEAAMQTEPAPAAALPGETEPAGAARYKQYVTFLVGDRAYGVDIVLHIVLQPMMFQEEIGQHRYSR